MHINAKETITFLKVLLANPHLHDVNMKCLTDSTTAKAAMSDMAASSDEVLQVVRALWAVCLTRNIYLQVSWIPGDDNEWADDLSRHFGNDDWKLNPYYFQLISRQMYGSHAVEVDWMATQVNAQVPRYCSKHPDIGSLGNCYHFSWGECSDWGYVNPPWNEIQQVLRHIQSTKARCIVILPVWKKPWYTWVMQRASSRMNLGKGRDVYLPGDKWSARPVGAARWESMAVLLDMRQQDR